MVCDKIVANMTHKEDESSGSLSEYVRLRRADALEARRVAEEAISSLARQSEVFGYEDLPMPLRNFFARFSVVELLEEVKARFWRGGSMSAGLIDGTPGVKLEHHSNGSIEEQDYVGGTTYDYACSPVNPTARTFGGWVKTGRWIPVDMVKVLIVKVIKVELSTSSSDYALQCLYFKKYGPRADILRDPYLNGIYYRREEPEGRFRATIDRRIEPNDPPDTLKKILGDNLLGPGGNLR